METIVVENSSQIYLDSRGDRFTALDNVSLTWNFGESIAVMGESGSGKSTLARLIAGLEKPVSGRVLIDGVDTAKWKAGDWRTRRTQLQAVFQDAAGDAQSGQKRSAKRRGSAVQPDVPHKKGSGGNAFYPLWNRWT